MDNSDTKIGRRDFLQKSAVVAAGSAAFNASALSYSRIVGANDRIALGHIGVGVRGTELDGMAAELKDSKNIEMKAVCDLWTGNLDRAVAKNAKYYGRPPWIRSLKKVLSIQDGDCNCFNLRALAQTIGKSTG